jgi:hypothetical protein
MIVEAHTTGTIVYGTPAQFRRAAVRLGTEEPRVCVQAIDAMAEAIERFNGYVFLFWDLGQALRDSGYV